MRSRTLARISESMMWPSSSTISRATPHSFIGCPSEQGPFYSSGVAPQPNYVVVSSDTHAAPDDLDQFLSYVEPADREAVAAFGDLSATAITMFGGRDQGEVDDDDPVRATAARRLAGMGVDTVAAHQW